MRNWFAQKKNLSEKGKRATESSIQSHQRKLQWFLFDRPADSNFSTVLQPQLYDESLV
jgi:hypothetical protein